jgi:hypothetical protein
LLLFFSLCFSFDLISFGSSFFILLLLLNRLQTAFAFGLFLSPCAYFGFLIRFIRLLEEVKPEEVGQIFGKL